jgi:hypothetical protein
MIHLQDFSQFVLHRKRNLYPQLDLYKVESHRDIERDTKQRELESQRRFQEEQKRSSDTILDTTNSLNHARKLKEQLEQQLATQEGEFQIERKGLQEQSQRLELDLIAINNAKYYGEQHKQLLNDKVRESTEERNAGERGISLGHARELRESFLKFQTTIVPLLNSKIKAIEADKTVTDKKVNSITQKHNLRKKQLTGAIQKQNIKIERLSRNLSWTQDLWTSYFSGKIK